VFCATELAERCCCFVGIRIILGFLMFNHTTPVIYDILWCMAVCLLLKATAFIESFIRSDILRDEKVPF